MVETEAYPLEEMINEIAGIFGLYFGFSVTSLVPLLYLAMQNLNRMKLRRTSGAVNEEGIRYCIPAHLRLKTFSAFRSLYPQTFDLRNLQTAHEKLQSEHNEMKKQLSELLIAMKAKKNETPLKLS